jgi:DNA-binding SARP family transcriptional activator/tetratricopeptide (TPR) repeat protein
VANWVLDPIQSYDVGSSLNVFGKVSIVELVPSRPTVGRLLATLILYRNRWVPRSVLSEAVWPDEPENPNRFGVTLSRLRTELAPIAGEARLETGTGGIRLAVADDLVDVVRFEHRLRDAVSVSQCREAFACWVGDPYADIANLVDAFSERVRLERVRRSVGIDSAERLLKAGHPSQALEVLELLEEDGVPDERASRVKALCSYRLGRATESLDIVRDLRAQMVEQFGLDLSPETQALELGILRHQVDPHDLSLVGREHERARFDALLAHSHTSQAQVVVIRGEPGIGKTSLALDLQKRAVLAGFLASNATCHRDEHSGSYRTVRSLLEPLNSAPGQRTYALDGGAFQSNPPTGLDGPGWLGALDEQSGAVRTVPESGASDLTEQDSSAMQSTDGDRLRTFDRVVELVDASGSAESASETGSKGLCWLVDDAQWADESSFALLKHTVRHVKKTKIWVLLTLRSDEVGTDHKITEWIADLTRNSAVDVIDLGGLEAAELSVLASYSGRVLTDLESRQLHRETGGSPFLALELLRSKATDLALPPSVEASLTARFARLGTAENELLEWLAASPEGLELALLLDLVDLHPDDVAAMIDVCERTHLLRTEVRGRRIELHIAHDLLRRFLNGRQGALRLSVRNMGLATVFRARNDVSRAAHHGWLAGPAGSPNDVVEWCRGAAEMALRVTAYEDAVTQLDRALEAATWNDASDVAHDRGDDGQTWLLLARARHRLGDAEGRRAAAERACQCARLVNDWNTFAYAALEHGGVRSTYGLASTVTMALLDEALRVVPQTDRSLRVLLGARAGQEAYHVQRFDQADLLTQEAEREARELANSALLAVTLEGRIWAMHRPGRIDERLRVCEEMVALAVASGQPEAELIGRIWRACAWVERGDLALVQGELGRLDELSAKLRIPSHRFRVLALQCTMAGLRGKSDAAFALAQQARDVGFQIEPLNAEQSFAAQLLPLLREQGTLAMALPLVEPMVEQYKDVAGWRCALSFVLAEAGELDRAREELRALSTDRFAIVPRDLAWMMAMSFLVDVCCATNEHEHAQTLVELLEPFADQHVGLFDLAWNGSVSHYLGRLCTLLGKNPEADRHLSVALKEHRKAEAPHMIERTLKAIEELHESERNS